MRPATKPAISEDGITDRQAISIVALPNGITPPAGRGMGIRSATIENATATPIAENKTNWIMFEITNALTELMRNICFSPSSRSPSTDLSGRRLATKDCRKAPFRFCNFVFEFYRSLIQIGRDLLQPRIEPRTGSFAPRVDAHA